MVSKKHGFKYKNMRDVARPNGFHRHEQKWATNSEGFDAINIENASKKPESTNSKLWHLQICSTKNGCIINNI
jgi:hypothetical protein